MRKGRDIGISDSSKTLANDIQYVSSWHGTPHWASGLSIRLSVIALFCTNDVKCILLLFGENLPRRDLKIASTHSKRTWKRKTKIKISIEFQMNSISNGSIKFMINFWILYTNFCCIGGLIEAHFERIIIISSLFLMVERIMKQYFGNWNLPEMRGQSSQISDRKDFCFESPISFSKLIFLTKVFSDSRPKSHDAKTFHQTLWILNHNDYLILSNQTEL